MSHFEKTTDLTNEELPENFDDAYYWRVVWDDDTVLEQFNPDGSENRFPGPDRVGSVKQAWWIPYDAKREAVGMRLEPGESWGSEEEWKPMFKTVRHDFNRQISRECKQWIYVLHKYTESQGDVYVYLSKRNEVFESVGDRDFEAELRLTQGQ